MGQSFDSVWGQEAACDALSRSIRVNRVASSYLLSGAQGTGKAKAAAIFANSLLCESSGDGPCGECRACKMFNAGTHPDFKLIIPSGVMIKVDQMRELISALGLKSYSGGRKVCVIQEAEKMNRETANGFLKTLEEPPDNSVLILVSSNPSGLLPTIVSRCRNVRFVPMAEEKLAKILEEKLSVEPEEALTLAHLAEGCPERALSDGVESIRQVDGEAMELISRLPRMNPREVIAWSEGWRNRREELPLLVDRLMDILRMAQRAYFTRPSGTMSPIMNMLGSVPGERLLYGFETLLDAKPALRFNPNIQLFLESNLFNLQSILNEGVSIAQGNKGR